jgi:hypothetical protein
MTTGEIETARPDLADPGAVVGWLLVLCLILTISPAAILYNIGAHVLPKLIGTHRSANILLLSVCCIQSIVLALFSIITGAKLWLVKPGAIKFAKRYLLAYLGAHIAYFILWILVDRPTNSSELARMAWHNVVRPLPFVALWYSYLEHSKRVRATYPSE